MKKFILFICATMLATALVSGQNLKVVTVSMSDLFDTYHKTEKFRERFSSLQQQAQSELNDKQADLQEQADQARALQEELQNPVLSDSAKSEKQAQLQQMVQGIQQQEQQVNQWRQQTMRDLQAQNNQKTQEFLGEIRDVVISVAKDEGADLVLDTSDGNGVPAVVFAAPELDITAKVEQLLNKDQPSAASAQ
ncbi:MAG: outer membrane protein [Puniceicoccaceae bacterium 5H]|nr:MAG: outer membrane protein [Puniceicoccaceae bacterium 5H]